MPIFPPKTIPGKQKSSGSARPATGLPAFPLDIALGCLAWQIGELRGGKLAGTSRCSPCAVGLARKGEKCLIPPGECGLFVSKRRQ